ncbi:MAG: alpha/beta hydrolase [Phycisphaerae bacterium]|nr:alpha/beta hydrolase [Phycisphaerae bacterium]
MDSIVTPDGARIAFKDWGPRNGRPVVFSHGWPLSGDAWDDQMLFLTERGFRCVAHDRRGHGRSSQPASGNDMDHYADDLAALVRALDLRDVTHVGHSTGGGEVARYVGRHGTSRVAKLVLIGAVPPQMLRTAANPDGLPIEAFDAIRAGVRGDRSSFYRAIATGPFFGFNRPGATVSQGLIDSFWMQGMQSGIVASYECIKAFSETDFRADLAKFDRPTLLLHGDDDQVVPLAGSALQVVKLVKHATLKVYPGGSHAIATINKDEVNADLLAFLNG